MNELERYNSENFEGLGNEKENDSLIENNENKNEIEQNLN